MKAVNISGKRFGHLVVISRAASRRGRAHWNCKCDCGNLSVTDSHNLRSGHTTSCGCHLGSMRHGHCTRSNANRSPTYRSWQAMIARCENPSIPGYAHYKKLGITVCDRWRHSFENFLADMGERPSLKLSLDRFPNNLGNYEPGNCRWATKREQANNRITNRNFEYQGRTLSVTELARAVGLPYELLRGRLRKGYTLDEALNPKRERGRRWDREAA